MVFLYSTKDNIRGLEIVWLYSIKNLDGWV